LSISNYHVKDEAQLMTKVMLMCHLASPNAHIRIGASGEFVQLCHTPQSRISQENLIM